MRTLRQKARVIRATLTGVRVDSFLVLFSSSPTPSIQVITSCVEVNLKLGDENLLTLKRFKIHYKCLSCRIRFELENFSKSNAIGTTKS